MDLETFEQETVRYLKACQKKGKFPNRAGLCTALNIRREEYFDMCKEGGKRGAILARFKEACEDAWVQRLGVNASQGAVFFLKNTFREDWNDDTTVKLVLPTPILGADNVALKSTSETKKLTAKNV